MSTLTAPPRQQEPAAGEPALEAAAVVEQPSMLAHAPARRRIFARRRPPLTVLDLLDCDPPAQTSRRARVT